MDEINKSCYKHFKFQIKHEPVETTQDIQFYALCRYLLNVEISNILNELTQLYGTDAPSFESIQSLIKTNCKKTNQITEIDLTIDESEENDSTERFEPESHLETMKQCSGTLYDWNVHYNNQEQMDELFNYSDNKSEFERLKFTLNCSDTNRIKRIQFYSLCRYQLIEQPSLILNELKRLNSNDAPSLSLLYTWITELWNDNPRSNTIEQDTFEASNDLPIDNHSKVFQHNQIVKKIEMRFDLFRSKSKNLLMQLKLKEAIEKFKSNPPRNYDGY